MEENVLTIPEAAKVLKVGRTTLYKLIKQGDIAIVKVGSLNRILESDLQAYLQKQKQGGKNMQAHPDNLETKTFTWAVNGVYTLTLEVETAKRDGKAATSFLPFAPRPIVFSVERDGEIVLRTSDIFFSRVRGKATLNIQKNLFVAVELPSKVAKALYPEEYVHVPIDGKTDVWWQFE